MTESPTEVLDAVRERYAGDLDGDIESLRV